MPSSLSADPAAKTAEPTFVHPGLLHSRADLDRMRSGVQSHSEPWYTAWQAFLKSRLLAANYQPQAIEVVGRGVGSDGQLNISPDASAVYYNAIAWQISGDDAYAKKTIEILNAWSSTCKRINGKDAVLCAGIYGYKFANAAEIMRHCGSLWPDKDVRSSFTPGCEMSFTR